MGMDQGFPGECVSKLAYAPSFIMVNNVRRPLVPSFTKSLATYANKMVCVWQGQSYGNEPLTCGI